jgi:hypothetical protein
MNVTQVAKYLREYDKHTAKEDRPILVFPFFPNWIGLLHCKIQRNGEMNLINFLTVCSTIFHHLYRSVALLRLLFVQFFDSLHEGVSRILSTFCLEMKSVLHVHFKSSCLCNPAEAVAFVYYFIRFFEIFQSIIRTNVRHSGLLHSRFRTSQNQRRRILVTRSDETGCTALILQFVIEIWRDLHCVTSLVTTSCKPAHNFENNYSLTHVDLSFNSLHS